MYHAHPNHKTDSVCCHFKTHMHMYLNAHALLARMPIIIYQLVCFLQRGDFAGHVWVLLQPISLQVSVFRGIIYSSIYIGVSCFWPPCNLNSARFVSTWKPISSPDLPCHRTTSVSLRWKILNTKCFMRQKCYLGILITILSGVVNILFLLGSRSLDMMQP